MNVSSSTKKPVLRRSIPYGAPYAYEKLGEKKHCMKESSISVGSLSTILLSIDDNRSAASLSDDDVGYGYSDSDSDSESSDDDGRLGATPSKMRGVFPPKKRGGFPSISPVKSSEDNSENNGNNETLDIPGLSDWSVDISRMTMPAIVVESGDNEAIAQDAYTTTHEEDVAFRQDGHNESETSSPQNSDGDAAIAASLREQLESLGLRLETLERAIFSSSDDLDRTIDVDMGERNHDVAFLVEEEDSTVESLANEITILEEIDNDDSVRKTRRSKQSLFVRFFFFGGCRKL